MNAGHCNKPYFVHKSSYVDDGVVVGDGSKIWHFSHIQSGAKIGENVIIGQNVNIGPNVIIGNNVKIQNNVSVYEGVEIEDDVFVGPSVVFTNVFNPRSFVNRKNEFRKTLIKQGTSLGANCTIVCGVIIGKYSLIGAGSVVTKNTDDYSLFYGNPARFHGFVCECGMKLNSGHTNLMICECGKKYVFNEGKIECNF